MEDQPCARPSQQEYEDLTKEGLPSLNPKPQIYTVSEGIASCTTIFDFRVYSRKISSILCLFGRVEKKKGEKMGDKILLVSVWLERGKKKMWGSDVFYSSPPKWGENQVENTHSLSRRKFPCAKCTQVSFFANLHLS